MRCPVSRSDRTVDRELGWNDVFYYPPYSQRRSKIARVSRPRVYCNLNLLNPHSTCQSGGPVSLPYVALYGRSDTFVLPFVLSRSFSLLYHNPSLAVFHHYPQSSHFLAIEPRAIHYLKRRGSHQPT
jgi:hypothetical protein